MRKLPSIARSVLLLAMPSAAAAATDQLLSLRGWHLAAVLLAAVVTTWGLAVYEQYRRHPEWSELPRLDKLLSVLSDMVGLAQLSAAMDSVRAHELLPIRWTQISSLIGETVGARRREARTSPDRTFYNALKWYGRHFGRRTQGLSEEWARRLFPPLVPAFFALSAIAASIALGASVTMHSPGPGLILLAAAALTTAGAAAAHVAGNPLAVQFSMASAGGVILALSGYLWAVGTGFQSATPNIIGRVLGVGFGLALIIWTIAAAADPNGKRRFCSTAAFATAILGITLTGINIWDKLHAGGLSFHDATNLVWPLGIVCAATLSAISRKEWLVGCRRNAVTGDSTTDKAASEAPDEDFG